MSLLNLLKQSLLEGEDKPSSGLSKKQKSDVVKKAKAGKDIGKKGKGFKDVATKAAKQYGSKEAGERVAAAAMWKNIKREGYDMDHPNQDHEVSMAMSSLRNIIQSAYELMEKLGNEERNIPGWIQDHITNSENYIEQAASGFHELEEDGPVSGSVNEKKLTSAEKNKKEEVLRSMAKKKGGKDELNPRDYAIATSQAIKSA
jgi:hypothetical protein